MRDLRIPGLSIAVIEEPERNIHPHLIARLMQLMRDASSKRQVIITTHNPELVRNSKIEDLLLVTRGKDGISSVTRPEESAAVREFLSRDIGVEELFTGGVLEGMR
jgi:predicted ATPase